jgi:hypothetical protein
MVIAMVSLETHLRRMREKRWKGKTAEEKKAGTGPARDALRDYWAKMTPEERSAEMKRRAEKRKKP